MFGVKKYLASEPGIINIAWIETESKKIPIDRMYLPESEVEDWAFYTARLPETHAATVPVIPDPKKYGKIVNGLKLNLFQCTKRDNNDGSTGDAELTVGIKLTGLIPRHILNLKKHTDVAFWMLLFTENNTFVGMKKLILPDSFIAICHEASGDFILLKPGDSDEVKCKVIVPWELGDESWKIVVGFGPFKHLKKDPPDMSYWQGELISERTTIRIEAPEAKE